MILAGSGRSRARLARIPASARHNQRRFAGSLAAVPQRRDCLSVHGSKTRSMRRGHTQVTVRSRSRPCASTWMRRNGGGGSADPMVAKSFKTSQGESARLRRIWMLRLEREEINRAFRGTGSVDKLRKKTHRMLAWGVLGSASDGLPFLLTHPVVFRSICND